MLEVKLLVCLSGSAAG